MHRHVGVSASDAAAGPHDLGTKHAPTPYQFEQRSGLGTTKMDNIISVQRSAFGIEHIPNFRILRQLRGY